MIKALIFLSLFSSSFAISATAPKTDIQKLTDSVQKQNNEIYKISAHINSLESELGQKNNSYIEQLKRTTKLEEKLNFLKDNLNAEEKKVINEEKSIKKLAGKLLLEKIDEDDDQALIRQKLYSEELSKKEKNLITLRETIKILKDDVSLYMERLAEFKKTEEDLYSVIKTLENEKKDLSVRYVQKIEEKNLIEKKLDGAVASFKASNMLLSKKSENFNFNLSLPLQSFTGHKISEKGINFKYKENTALNATASGTIAFASDLATYGKVIIIDHGNNLRSVLLGDFSLKIKKGDLVSEGDILGYANGDGVTNKNLYYELRKQNKAQKSFKVVEKEKSIKFQL